LWRGLCERCGPNEDELLASYRRFGSEPPVRVDSFAQTQAREHCGVDYYGTILMTEFEKFLGRGGSMSSGGLGIRLCSGVQPFYWLLLWQLQSGNRRYRLNFVLESGVVTWVRSLRAWKPYDGALKSSTWPDYSKKLRFLFRRQPYRISNL
jgi:hypothetical protein